MFQEKIKELRLNKKFTQEQVAKKIGITRPAYTAYESGKRQPDFDTLQRIAELYEVSTDYILGRFNAPSANINETSSYVRTIAAHIDDDVTEEQLNNIIDYIDFITKKNKKD